MTWSSTGVLLLGLAGIGLMVWAVYRRPASFCGMPAPDGRPCAGAPGHVGSHHSDGMEWSGRVWAPAQAANITEGGCVGFEFPTPVSSWKMLALIAGVLAVLFAVGLRLLTQTASPPEDPHAHCAMAWADAYPGHPLCPDSPDQRKDNG